jgi:glycosyltransferase involved in cell wall biosynthesis
MQPLRIGVNALYLIPGGVGGTEIYLRSLLEALARIDGINQYFVFTNQETGGDLVPPAENFSHLPQHVRATSRPARMLWEQIVLPLEVSRSRIDVLFNPGFTAPLYCPCPMLTVFHDLQHKRHPEFFRRFDLLFWRIFLFAAAHRSSRLLAVSEQTASDLREIYRLPAERIEVVNHGVDPEFFRLSPKPVTPPYVLCVSTLHPHKNLDRLLGAFATFHRDRPEFRLVLAGMRGFHADSLDQRRASLGLTDAAEFTGWISRKRLYELYAGAAAFLYPSTFEGFGMPILEAMAAGIPSACSRIQPLAGIAGNAALTFDPYDEAAIGESMARIVGDRELRTRLSEAGPARASEFTWENTARRTLSLLQSVAARS